MENRFLHLRTTVVNPDMGAELNPYSFQTIRTERRAVSLSQLSFPSVAYPRFHFGGINVTTFQPVMACDISKIVDRHAGIADPCRPNKLQLLHVYNHTLTSTKLSTYSALVVKSNFGNLGV